MNKKYKGLFEVAASSLVLVSFLLFRLAKISPIIGGSFKFFSLSDVAMPLSGTLGLGIAALVASMRLGTKMMLAGVSLTNAGFYLPGLFAAGCWTERKKFFQLFVPLVAMTLFVVHPIGFYAAPYSLYWLIPVTLYWLDKDSLFLDSLASTFVAHAVGSVIWLYVFRLPVQTWWALIPVVAVERLFFASAMTVIYGSVVFARRIFVSKILSFSQIGLVE